MTEHGPIRIAAVCGFPPNPQGESHYSGQVFTRLAEAHPEEVILKVFAHKNLQTHPNDTDLPENLQIERITGGSTRIQRALQVIRLAIRIHAFRPDVVHFQGTHTTLYGGFLGEPATLLIWWLRFFGIPTILTLHSTWMPEDLRGLWIGKGLGNTQAMIAQSYASWHNRAMARAASIFRILIAGNSSPCTEEYLKGYSLSPRQLIEEPHPCFFNPVTRERQSAAKATIGLANKRIILANGFVRPDKGYHLLLEVAEELFSNFPDLAIVIAGQPLGLEGNTYAQMMVDLRNNLSDPNRVRLVFQYIADEEMANYFDAADVIAIPYARALGASGPIHHALGRAKPVVATRTGHNRGLENVVRLFWPANAAGLAKELHDLFSSPCELQRLSEVSSEYAKSHSWESLAEAYLADYRNLSGKSVCNKV